MELGTYTLLKGVGSRSTSNGAWPEGFRVARLRQTTGIVVAFAHPNVSPEIMNHVFTATVNSSSGHSSNLHNFLAFKKLLHKEKISPASKQPRNQSEFAFINLNKKSYVRTGSCRTSRKWQNHFLRRVRESGSAHLLFFVSSHLIFEQSMQQYLRLLGRDAWVLNLDPANEGGSVNGGTGTTEENVDEIESKSQLPYETIFDVCEEVVNLSSVMKKTGLGPNGGLIYCMEYMEAHVDDIILKINEKLKEKTYLLIDLPGQVELYTHSTCVQQLLSKMIKAWDLRLSAVQLIDAHYCTDASKFLSAAMLGTTTMLRLELPTVNVLSKVDLLSRYGDLPLQLEFFTECHDLERLVPFLEHQAMNHSKHDNEYSSSGTSDYVEDPDYQRARTKRRSSIFFQKYAKLHNALAEVVEDFGLLSFLPLNITDAGSVGRVLAKIDKCNGYVFMEGSVPGDLFQCAIQADICSTFESLADIQERIAAPEIIDELAIEDKKGALTVT